MHRLADGHRAALHGRQAHHARVQRPVRGRRLSATATGGRGTTASTRRCGRRQPIVGRRVPTGGRRRTATGRPSGRPAAGQRPDVVETVPGRSRGRGPSERRGGAAAAAQWWRGRRGPQIVRRNGQTSRVARQPDGRRQEARRRGLEEQRVQPVRQ